jgi:protease I
MGKALIIVHDGFTDSEFTYARDRLIEEDFEIDIATIGKKEVFGFRGEPAKPTLAMSDASGRVNFRGDTTFIWDILILVGGVKAWEKLRQDADTISLIQQADAAYKIIASMCHGAQGLIESGVAKGCRISGYYSIKTDIVNSGSEYSDQVTTDGRFVSAPHYRYNGPWMGAVLRLWRVTEGIE